MQYLLLEVSWIVDTDNPASLANLCAGSYHFCLKLVIYLIYACRLLYYCVIVPTTVPYSTSFLSQIAMLGSDVASGAGGKRENCRLRERK